MLHYLFGRNKDVAPGRSPKRPSPRTRIGLEQLEARENPVAFYVVPGAAGTSTALNFSWLERNAAFFNEIGVYTVDNGTGTVNGLAPTDASYAQAALAEAVPVFARGQSKGARSTQTFEAGTVLGFYLVQNSTTAVAQALNPTNTAGAGPVTFFSFAGASPDQFDHVLGTYSGTQATLRFEDGLRGGDRDYNDAVIRVSAVNPNITPGATGQVIPTAFRLNQRTSAFHNEIGVYAFDDASGTVDGVSPGDPGYAAAVLRSAKRQVLFDRNAGAGTISGANLPAGGNFGFYLIQNASADTFLQLNPTNSTAGGPVMFFSQANANPDKTVHVRQNGNTLYFEDGLNGGDQNFKDAVISFVYGTPVGAPSSPPVSPPPPPESPPPEPPGAPVVTVALTTDTADPSRPATASDNITATLGISGTVTDPDGIVALEARLGTSGNFTSIFGSLVGSNYTISAAQLQALNGNVALTPGTYTVQVRATDRNGTVSNPVSLTFTYDTSTTATLLLDAGSDTGTQGEFRTETTLVTLRGTAEAGATVRLESRAVGAPGTVLGTTTANALGQYTFTNVSLAAGPNGFKVFVTDAAGNVAESGATITRNLAPTASATPTPVAGTQGGSTSVDLNTIFSDPDASTSTIVRFTTNSFGTFYVQLFDTAAPGHATNFENYATGNKYDNSFIHRLVSGFVIQGGGFAYTGGSPNFTTVGGALSITSAAWAAGTVTVDTATPHGLTTGQIVTIAGVTPSAYNGTVVVTVVDADTFTFTRVSDPGVYTAGGTVALNVTNEAGLPNSKGTVALAKLGGSASSGTNQFFFNLGDNVANLDNQNGGFSVFGQVVGNGQAVLDAIAALPTRNFSADDTAFGSVPVQPNPGNTPPLNSIQDANANNLALFTDVSVVAPLTYTVTGNTDTSVVTAATVDPATGALNLTFGNTSGTATITITATDPDGATVTHNIVVTVP